ncbi:anion transporter [Erwinia toletana]|uniref:Anion transporter n=1 Tax=Winslowiella toletana TaxID=92490 RepID=A0ABS4P8E5_9GAMM|nr:SLC13 family permease [Winslowiella toletana]MBP2168870.1 anion transporter [Winslowiella toletana]
MTSLPPEIGLTALVVAMTILLWATALLPEFITALLFFAAAMLLHIAPAATVFSGFASSAFWLVLSGFVLGLAIRKVGLADRLARTLAAPLTASWPRMVGGVIVISYLLAFVMPSNMGRIALLMPIVGALAKQAGLYEGSRGWTGLALAVGFGTFQLSASILPANVPNLVMTGAAENSFGLHLGYMPWMLLHTPVVGLLKGALLTLCICKLFPATPSPVTHQQRMPPLSGEELRLIAVLLLTLLLWMTDSLHGISPAWVGLTAACFCLLPRVGFLSSDAFGKGVNFRTCIYVAAILGVTAVVVESNLGNRIASALLAITPLHDDRPFLSFLSLNAVTTALNFVVTANGVPAMFTPMAQSFAEASGFSLLTVVMIQVFAYATPLLPYQASPIVVAMGLGNVPARDGLKLCLLVALVSALVLLPLDYLWFKVLGYV